MHKEDKRILSLWAQGMGGANQRLAKRAWTVLHERTARPRDKLGMGWANSSDDREWNSRFNDMGLVGLFDSPRAGRPLVYVNDLDETLPQIKAFADSRLANSPEARRHLLADLSRNQKEALWRVLRSRGETAMRSVHGKDLTVNAPKGLQPLVSIMLTASLKCLAFLPEATTHLSETKGTLVGMTKVKPSDDVNRGIASRSDLIQALQIEVLPPKRILEDPHQLVKWMHRRERHLLNRTASHLTELALRYPRCMAVFLFADMASPSNLMQVLSDFRARKLWRHQHQIKRSEGLLKDLRVVAFDGTWDSKAQTALAAHLEDAPGKDLSELLDALTLKRRVPFCWIRQDDSDEPEEESNWLAREGPDQQPD